MPRLSAFTPRELSIERLAYFGAFVHSIEKGRPQKASEAKAVLESLGVRVEVEKPTTMTKTGPAAVGAGSATGPK